VKYLAAAFRLLLEQESEQRKNPIVMKTLANNLFRLFIIILFVGVTACNKDDDGDDNGNLSTAELLIGTWTVTDFDLDIEIGSRSLIDYLIEVEGLSPEEAAAQNAIFEAFLESEVTGTLTLKADNTYVSNFGDGSTTGTWSLSADEKTLTLVEGDDTIVITINSITKTTLKATISETSAEDLDDDPLTPDVIISVDAILTLTK